MKFKIGEYVQFVNTPIAFKYEVVDEKMQILFYNDDANTYLVIGENKYLDVGENKYHGYRYLVFWVKESDLMLWNDSLADNRYNFNMKVVCTYSAPGSAFKTGHVYEIRRGSMYVKGYGHYGYFDSLDNLNNTLSSQFIEFKGEA